MPAAKETLWQPEEDQLIRDLVKNQISSREMHVFLPNRTTRAIECRVYFLGLKSGTPRTRHSKDEAFWEIPNPINSYYAGILAADGSVDTKRHILQWGCAVEDREYIEGFIRSTRYTGKIGESIKHGPKYKPDHIPAISVMSWVHMGGCKKWNEDLARVFNVIPNKTYRLAAPNLGSDYLMCCYLCGLLDGDGAISFARTAKVLHIAYGSASRDIVEWVQRFVDEKFPFRGKDNVRAKVKPKLDGRYFHYSIYGIKAAKLIELFRTLPVPRFKRKWDSPELMDILARYHADFPEFFTPDQTLSFDANGTIVIGAVPVAA